MHLFTEWKIQFRLGSSLLGKRIRLYVNHPPTSESSNAEQVAFDRNCYGRLEWQHESRNKDDDTVVYANIVTFTSGSFHYYFIDQDR